MTKFLLSLALVLLLAWPPSANSQVEDTLVWEDLDYDSSFEGPLIYCRRSDTAAALSDDAQTMPVLCDDSGRVRVSGTTGTEYTEGDTDPSITGTAIMWEDVANTLRAVSAAKPLPVDVTVVVPGTGATNLGKARSSTAGATATGVAIFGIHQDDNVKIEESDGEYAVPHISDLGALEVEPEQHHIFDEMDATTGWAVLSDSADTLALSTTHVLGDGSLSFNKVNGSGSTLGGIDKTITAINMGEVSPHDIIQTVTYVSSLTNVDYVFVRIGTDSSNYNEFRIADDDLTAGEWQTLLFEIGDASYAGQAGNGVDWTAITYLAVGYNFDAESDALAGIAFDEISFHTNQHVNASINTEVTSSVSSANVNLQKIGGSAVDKGSGNVSNGTQRVVWPDNVALPPGTNAIGKLAANDGVDIGNVDVTSMVATPGLLHANSPVTLIDTFSLFDGSGETQIATTNLGASKAYSVPGTGRLLNICVIVSLGTPFAEDMSIIFFDADPSVTIEDTSLTLAASQNITNIISLSGSDFRDNFATTKVNCQTIDEHYVAITHVVFASEGATTYDDEDIEIRLVYRRRS